MNEVGQQHMTGIRQGFGKQSSNVQQDDIWEMTNRGLGLLPLIVCSAGAGAVAVRPAPIHLLSPLAPGGTQMPPGTNKSAFSVLRCKIEPVITSTVQVPARETRRLSWAAASDKKGKFLWDSRSLGLEDREAKPEVKRKNVYSQTTDWLTTGSTHECLGKCK